MICVINDGDVEVYRERPNRCQMAGVKNVEGCGNSDYMAFKFLSRMQERKG